MGLVWLLSKLLLLIVLVGVAFFVLGWWLRGRSVVLPSVEEDENIPPPDETPKVDESVLLAERERADKAEHDLAELTQSTVPAHKITELEELLAAKTSEHEQARIELVKLRDATGGSVGELERLRAAFASLNARYKALDKESFTYSAHNSVLEKKIAALRAELKAAPGKASAPSSSAETELLRKELEALQNQLREATAAQVTILTTDSTDSPVLNEDIEASPSDSDEPAKKEEDLDDKESLPQLIENDPVPAAEPEPIGKECDKQKTPPAVVGNATETVANIPADKPQEDNLLGIKGVTEATKQKLNRDGIFTFKQIVGWSKADIKAFSGLLDLGDRIARNDWQGQARELHFQKHGEALP